ncbi:T9SS C-terminal target domain-containing protein [Chryseobacterium nematophagum]|uniref:T9SS C-terminal target domain-containing protein n=1 Tax=Chryseobacterium nematophagum TaxID=2305228 RepID=A0A3M7TJD8_9FLAO|nr:GEVED domain-containing protein [Chryseobacterium nematophagum]RNA63671.1 T9SS C-terminal target domain-containing protein [Chryseobacterium nematophagum]
MKKLIFMGLCLLSIAYSAQQRQWSCGFDNVQEPYQRQNEEIDDVIYKMRNQILKQGSNTPAKTVANKTVNGVYEIPVVVHVIAPTGASLGTAYNKTDAQIQAWLDHCNQMYAGTYQWLQGVPADFGTAAIMPIKLVLAKRDPNCNPTTGIVRYNGGTISGYDTYGVKMNTSSGATTAQVRALAPHWPEASYFNIYIINKVDGGGQYGIMGWAGLPQNPNSSFESFMKSFVVTLQDDVTLAHEFGHSMGLLHTFGNANSSPPAGTTSTDYCPLQTNNNCNRDDDGVCDTERSRSLLSDFPTPTNADMNYCTNSNYQGVQYNMMNYSNPIAFKFTDGQHDRSALYFFAFRGALSTSLGATAPSTSTPIGTPVAACTPSGLVNAATENYFVGPTLVKLGNINNASTGVWTYAPNYYEDYTGANCLKATSTELAINQTQNIQVNVTDSNNSVRVWIDYNNNGTFETSELVATEDNIAIDPVTIIGTFNGTFTAPSSTVMNTPLRMRVIVDYQNPNITPCGQLQWGQAEDYTVKFVTNLSTIDAKFSDNDDFIIYPNPTTAHQDIFIKTKNAKNIKVTITDMAGRLIETPSVKDEMNGTFRVNHHLLKGVYMVKVSNGKDTKASKLIVN